jgi:aldose 1-epimerase
VKITKIYHYFPDHCNHFITDPGQIVYCLENSHHIRVGLMNFGATVVSVEAPDRMGNIKNIALSLERFEGYSEGGTFAGETLGPVAGRIRDGILPIAGHEYRLPRNESGNTLHSGPENLSRTFWNVTRTFCEDSAAGVVFEQRRLDGEDGFPGDRIFSVCYTLTEENTLQIRYQASTSKTTWINLSSHLYWNLSGNFTAPGDFHLLKIRANRVLFNNGMHLPVSCESVAGTPFDFQRPCSVASAVSRNALHEQLLNARGYNNAFLLSEGSGSAAELTDPVSGRSLAVETDYPSLVFYSGGYLGGAGYTPDRQKIAAGSAYALEAQYLPGAPHLQGNDAPFLKPCETYQKFISFHLGIRLV